MFTFSLSFLNYALKILVIHSSVPVFCSFLTKQEEAVRRSSENFLNSVRNPEKSESGFFKVQNRGNFSEKSVYFGEIS